MGKTCPTPSLNSSISNSVITNASSNHNHHHQQHQQHHQHQHHHQHHHQSVPLPPPPPPQPIPPQQHQQQQQQQQQRFPQKYMNSKRKHANNYHNMLMHPGAHLDHNNYLHLNSLWSIWYGVLLTLFQGYLAVHGAYRFLGCSLITWKIEPVAELNLQIVLSGVVFILLPFFFASAVFKVGNLANDGIKLATGSKERRCSMSPHDGLEEEARGGTLRALWTHGGPTSAFVHIVIAVCLLLPRLLLEARIIENGLLPRENIWQTELDFIAVNRRNLVVLSVVTAPYQNGTGIHGDVSNSLEDDQDDDYYNDTMFTAVGAGAAGTDINNNMFDMLTSSKQVKFGNRKAEAKAKSSNNIGVDFRDGGKTRYFEVPDLINQNSKEERRDQEEANNNDDGVADVDTNRKNNNKFDFNEGTDIYDGRGAEGGGVFAGGGEGEGESEGRIFVEHLDTKDIWSGKAVDIPQTVTAKTSTTTTARNSVNLITEKSNNNNNKNYDQMWDKLGTLGKSNSLDVAASDIEAALTTIKTTTTTNSQEQNSSVKITSSVRPKTTTTNASNELGKTIGRGLDATLGTTAGATTTAATTKYLSSVPERTSNTKFTTTTTTQTPSVSNKSSNRNNYNDNDNEDILVAVSSTTTTAPPVAHTQPTRTHHHHNHKEQPQQAHHNSTHSAKSSRKHHGHNRQHHRQRGGQQHNRRHHTNTAGGRSSESTATRNSRLDTGRAAVDLRPSNAYGNNKAAATEIDLNRLDELDLSASTNFEQSINLPRGQNRGDSAASFETDALDYDARRNYGKSTATISTTTRDSNIHIVKPEKLPEIIPSTPLTSNSKIIEIKTKSGSGSGSKSASNGNIVKRIKRMADEEMQVEIEPEYLVGELAGNDSSEYMAAPSSVDGSATSAISSKSSAGSSIATAQQPPQTSLVRLDGFAGMLQIFFGIEKPIDMSVFDHPPSAEFVNLVFALLVWCVRYPAVFWTTTKSFATIFSIQMIAVALDITFSYIGAANLYKLQVYSEAMPIQNSGLILNGVVTLALFLLSSVLMIASSMIMYLYGHGRLAAKMRDRSLITMKSSETWIYFAHCASLCYVLALAVVKAPLLNDLSVTYRNNLHCPTFFSALISVVHLLLWIVIWLGLTAKRRWTFKLPPMDAYGITKATTQPLLMANRSSLPSAGSVSGSGSNMGSSEQKSSSMMSSGGMGGGRGGKLSTESSTDGGGDDVYWPKLTPSSPKLKVTFNEVPSTSDDVLLIGDHEQNDGKRHSPRGTAICFASVAGEIDDGEYATLRTASAATMAGITVTSMSSSSSTSHSRTTGKSNIDPVMTIGCGNETHVGGLTNNHSTTPTGAHGMKLLQLSEYDELPPPPPQLMPTSGGNHSTAVCADYTNYVGGGGGVVTDPDGSNYNNTAGSGSFGDDSASEEGKLLACVRDDSVTYASTRDLEPPTATTLPPPPPPKHATDQQPTGTSCANMNSSVANGLAEMNRSSGGAGGGSDVASATIAGRAPQAIPENMQLSSSPEHLVSPLAPVTVTVHTNEAHIASSSTPRCLRRADSGVPNEALTPRSDTTSTTESTTSPPERAPSESSSGVHSGEERDIEVVIRPRSACKPPPKPPQPPIQEEPYGRCTNMRMSSFGGDAIGAAGRALNSATLPLTRSAPEQKFDYANHCSTMPLPAACHSQQQAAQAVRGSGNYGMTTSAYSMHSQPPLPLPPPPPPQHSGLSSFRSQYANSAVAMAGVNVARMQQQQHQQQHEPQQQYSAPQSISPPPPPPPVGMHTTLPNGVRYSNPHFLRRLPHVTKAAESPYGHLGLGAGHHTFSKLLQDPLQHSLVNTAIPEDRDSANYSMSSEQDCGNLYATAESYN
ncbi:protein tincar [Bactrocera dorsalis]|uniref:Protein tincar n=2 Tax=Bactrocera dorsalis TaxID=27457 RepID=A0A6I9VL69_BACDO|nr:protein tincar [Bactrocera dorsalis]XP_049306428.1 protein tincar [Bactrocera dorsalis]XP_049306429.1 protein tincar [Bactrocera dorsalis]XP_049306430.1 protein tincar [Bactrocera dorsalis]XP_049306432.1 protein tincar [Bactrocera dorsalis]XP_049306433.1 protein tincar [Bactrocera dorsalis]XP_049306434.1 protein tincar [Bactrocera dorsalis]